MPMLQQIAETLQSLFIIVLSGALALACLPLLPFGLPALLEWRHRPPTPDMVEA